MRNATRIDNLKIKARAMTDQRALYYSIANDAIMRKWMTAEQRDIIARIGHRKEQYWDRHVLDLVDFIHWKLHSPFSPRNLKSEQ